MNLKRQLNRKEVTMIVILAVLVLFYAYYFLVNRPISNKLAELDEQIAATETQIQTFQQRKADMVRMQKELESTTNVPIPDYDNLQDLIVFTHAVLPAAAEYDVSYSDPSPVADGSDILGRSMQISFTASSYETARKILLEFENAPYRCLLNDVSITSAANNGGSTPITSGPVNVSVSVSFYEYLEPKAPAIDLEALQAEVNANA